MLKLLLTILLFFNICFANSISWYALYDKAFEVAKKQKKHMMIFLASSKNKSSNEILRKHFQNKNYINYLNQNFINILITVEHKSSYPIELFYTTNFPSIFFASYMDESFLSHPIYDFKSEKEFTNILYSIDIEN